MSQKPKILIVSGTRPDTIKLAPLILKLRKNRNFDTVFVASGQHKELLKQALDTFDLKPDITLKLMKQNQTLVEIITALLNEADKLTAELKPDLMMVHGDTSTAVAFAMAGFCNGVEVAHVEAGLRTYDLDNPFPEEGFRQKIDTLSKHLFTPTQHTKNNLKNRHKDVYVTGNTVVDSIDLIKSQINVVANTALAAKSFDKKTIFVTLHRRENFGKAMQNIFEALKLIVDNIPNTQIIYPVHLNPNVKLPAEKYLAKIPNIHLIKPLIYRDTLGLLDKCDLVISDSGGIQEEAPAFGKKVLVTRKLTERQEGIHTGFLEIVGTDTQNIYETAKEHLEGNAQKPVASNKNPFGDGNACNRIESYLERHFGFVEELIPEFFG